MPSIEIKSEVAGAEAPVVEQAVEAPAIPDAFKNEDGSLNQEAMMAAWGVKPAEATAEVQPKDEGSPADKPEATTTENFINSTLQTAGIDRDALTAELQEKGELSEASYEALAKAGFPKAEVDQYLAGGQAAAQAEAAAGAEIVTAAHEAAGGEENFKSMSAWAAENFSDDQLKSYNAMVESGDKVQTMAGINYLKSLYEASEGAAPQRTVQGNGSPAPVSTFRSNAELTAAMKDPRYRLDPAYRQDVQDKLARSSLF